MNVKFSQLPVKVELKEQDVFPILSDGNNYMTPVKAVYTYLSGNKFIDIYASYTSLSGYLLSSANLGRSVYATYNANSANYMLLTDFRILNWNSVFSTVITNSGSWRNASNYVSNVSSVMCFSNTSLIGVPCSAIKNMVAITQVNYDELVFTGNVDPQTFYVIAS